MKRRALLRAGASSLMAMAAAPLLSRSTPSLAIDDCCPPEGLIRLCCNENPYGPSPMARQAIQEASILGNRYPQAPIQVLKEAIAEANGVSTEQVLIAPGSVSILRLVAWWLARREKAVLSAEVTFPWLLRFAQKLGCGWLTAPMTEDLHFDLGAIENGLDKEVGLVYLCNPNNPTGTSLPLQDIHQFCRKVSPDYPIFLDEAYVEYLPDYPQHNSAALLADYPNVMISRTFSKIYGMAGMRVGYLLASASVVEELEQLDIGYRIGVSNISASAALASLADKDFVATSLAKNLESRAIVQKQLRQWDIPQYASTANFIYADMSRYSIEPLRAELKKQEISLNPAERDGQVFARISLSSPNDMYAFAKRMDQFFTNHK